MDALIAAAAVFVGLHLIPSTPARGWIAGSLGENVYLGLFSIASVAGLVWLIVAYRTAPHVELWRAGAALGRAPAIVMPIAFGAMNDFIGIWTSCFMLLFVVVAVSLLWMHAAIAHMERVRAPESRGPKDFPEIDMLGPVLPARDGEMRRNKAGLVT